MHLATHYTTSSFYRYVVFIILASVLGTGFYLWYVSSGTMLFGTGADRSIALGRLFGICAQLLLLFQVLLVARIGLLEHAFGFDKMNAVHRWTGFAVLLFLFAHPLLLTYGYATLGGQTMLAQFVSFLNDWHDVASAFFAVCLYAVIGFTSWHIVRYRVKYEAWYLVHFCTYLALIIAFDHQTKFGTFSGGTFAVWFWQFLMYGTVGLFLLYRWVDPLWLSWKHRLRVDKVVQENNDVVSVYVTGIRMNELVFEAGQYTSWRFHFGPLWRQAQTGFLFPHPFSFSQSFNGTHIRLTAKALGDFTKQLPTLEPGVRVTIARPLGRFVLPTVDKAHGVDPKTKVLFIAGGIGITPLRALAEAAHGLGLDSCLLYSARTAHDFPLLDECKAFVQKVTCFVSQEPAPQDGFTAGIIDAAVIQRECPDVRDRHVYICGPTPMMNAMVEHLLAIDVPSSQIHYEKFGY